MHTNELIHAQAKSTYIDGQTDRVEGHAYELTIMRTDETEVCIGRTIHNDIFVEYLHSYN